MKNETLSLLILILGSIQAFDILVSYGLYHAYNKSKDYLTVIIIWLGMFLFFISSHLLGEVHPCHIFMSYIFAGLTSVAMGQLLSRLYQFQYSWKKFAKIIGVLYFIGLSLCLLGLDNFTLLGLILAIGIVLPIFYACKMGFKIIKKNPSSSVDTFFLTVILIWGIHFLDYPVLRPMTNLSFSIFGFSFALALTYLTSILFPVLVNKKIHRKLTQKVEVKLKKTEKKLNKAQMEIIRNEKLAMVGTLTAGIAHEIKNPLNIIKNANLLIKEYFKKDIEDYYEFLSQGDTSTLRSKLEQDQEKLEEIISYIDKNIDRADLIIKNMLLQSGKSSELEMINPNLIVEESLQFFLDSSKEKFKEFSSNYSIDLKSTSEIRLSVQEFGRVIINLLDNAYYALKEKKHDDGFIPIIKISTSEDESYFCLSIYDNGCGIPEKLKKNVYDPFYTTKPPGTGTGLGLYMVNEIVKAHKGLFLLESEVGEYTEITIKIPK